jgi:hypothetical protein
MDAPLRLSDDRRYLVDAADQPFFYFADTAWSIVWKGTPDQWATYLDRRVAQGFSVLQVTLLPWRWEWTDVEGNRPFHDGDPARPNDAYFARYDRFLAMAAERGLYTCLMLIWGGPRPLLPAVHFDVDQAVAFAGYAVARFASHPMIWSLSGDAEYVQELAKWEAVGRAVEAADPRRHPTTNHLPPSMNWRFLHHDSPWHDFHMLQTGHRRRAMADVAALPLAYHRREPVKAVVNGEPWYENHPSRDTAEFGPNFTPFEARYAFWVSILSGATMGHTYGAQGIWNWKRPGDDETMVAGPQIGPPWFEALEYAGAEQCGLGARFLRQQPWWRLVPAPGQAQVEPPIDERTAPETVHHARPAGSLRPACALVPDRLLLAYFPEVVGKPVVKGLTDRPWRAAWLDPRSGARHDLGPAEPALDLSYSPPAPPSPDDWLLVLESDLPGH